MEFDYGLLLPHFGRYASRESVLESALLAEDYGFDSVWVRDHVLYEPYELEDPDPTFFEALLTLSLVAGATKRIKLGTAALVPHRHPIHLAQLLGTLNSLAGDGRLLVGVGTGAVNREFEQLGLGTSNRRALLSEQLEILELLATGDLVSHRGEGYNFDGARLAPSFSGAPVWLCGTSPAAVRWAVEAFDGWLPGRITFSTYSRRMSVIRQLLEKEGRSDFVCGAIPITSPGATREEGLSKVNWHAILAECRLEAAAKDWMPPPSGHWQTPDDLEGAIIAGPPELIAEETHRYQDLGLRHIVYDLRARFGDVKECISILGEEVLPQLAFKP